jgi:TatD DNase family protein
MTTQSTSFFDSHAHLDMLAHRGLVLEDVIQQATESGVQKIVTIACADRNGEFGDGVAPATRYNHIYLAAGVHPHAASMYSDEVAERLKTALRFPRAVALGEIGLDYHYNYSSPDEQRRAFVKQIQLAHRLNLPVVVHTRNADDDTISILQGEGVTALGGVIHCFSSGPRMAEAALELGMYLSFSGIVTFPKSAEVQDVAGWAPTDRILCETDSPFLSPAPKRGGINTPEKVSLVVKKMADIRDVDLNALAPAIFENTCRCFGISPQ